MYPFRHEPQVFLCLGTTYAPKCCLESAAADVGGSQDTSDVQKNPKHFYMLSSVLLEEGYLFIQATAMHKNIRSKTVENWKK